MRHLISNNYRIYNAFYYYILKVYIFIDLCFQFEIKMLGHLKGLKLNFSIFQNSFSIKKL